MKNENAETRTEGWGSSEYDDGIEVFSLRNEVQVALWNNELCGQISDGLWENSGPWDHWKPWGDCEAVAADDNMKLGINFYASKRGYRFSALIEYVGDRMVNEVERDTGIVLTETQLRKELNEISRLMKRNCR